MPYVQRRWIVALGLAVALGALGGIATGDQASIIYCANAECQPDTGTPQGTLATLTGDEMHLKAQVGFFKLTNGESVATAPEITYDSGAHSGVMLGGVDIVRKDAHMHADEVHFSLNAGQEHYHLKGHVQIQQTVAKDDQRVLRGEQADYDVASGDLVIEGQVLFVQGDRRIAADTLTFTKSADLVHATGHVVLTSGSMEIRVDGVDYNTKTQVATILGSTFDGTFAVDSGK